DLVTPLARDRARERGVQIVIAGEGAPPAPPQQSRPPLTAARQPGNGSTPSSAPPPAAVAGPPGTLPVSGALYRRGAPAERLGWPVPQRSGNGHGHANGNGRGGRSRVTVVGAGHVGAQVAARLADADRFGEVVIVDVADGLADGIALDLWHSSALRGFDTRVTGSTDLAAGAGSDVVVITAGRARQPGMTRTDLTAMNAAIVGEISQGVARHSPDAIVVVVTNPLDEMTELAWRTTGFAPQRVMGMAGVLDTARFCALAALAGVGRPDQVSAVALGSHGEEMVIPLSQATAGGRPLTSVLDGPTLEALVNRARDSGAEVVRHLRTGSAFFAPAASVARMVLAMAADTREVLPACVRADGTYGIRDVYLGLPARIGRAGVVEIVELPLAAAELEMLRAAAARIDERARQLV
ncbi:MAG TPA: malate dehydrogenase, partial [Candidatus Dormibacteraeota bacterium]|nr:malate dehydrogenase [Candidatus Dormibacteraeota bacterium]